MPNERDAVNADETATETETRGATWAHHDELDAFSPRDGISLRLVSGERLMVNWVRIEPHRTLPSHHHPHEQIGVVLEGMVEVTIADETRCLEPGHAYVVPPGVIHAGATADEGCLVLETFSPPREDYLKAAKAAGSTSGT